MYVCMYVYMYVCVCMCVYVCICVCMYVCMHVCLCLCVYQRHIPDTPLLERIKSLISDFNTKSSFVKFALSKFKGKVQLCHSYARDNKFQCSSA